MWEVIQILLIGYGMYCGAIIFGGLIDSVKDAKVARLAREVEAKAWRARAATELRKFTLEREKYNSPEAQAQRTKATQDQAQKDAELKRSKEYQRRVVHAFMKSPEWQRLRAQVFARDGKKCANRVCQHDSKVVGLVYHVDHIQPKSEHPELMRDMNNLQVLCEYCNVDKGKQELAVWSRKQYSAWG